MIGTQTIANWLRRFETLVAEHEAELTNLDSHIGDADHGVNLIRGLRATTDDLDAPTLPVLCKTVGMSLLRHVGGTSGPLLATLFLRMAAAMGEDAVEISEPEFVRALRAGIDGLAERGNTKLGDKTMFDAFAPAIATLERETADGVAFPTGTRKAFEAAERGRDETAALVARKGRASYLGQRSTNHVDPGAASTALLFRALAEVVA